MAVELEHLHEPDDFLKYGVLRTPGLVVNEKLLAAGRLPNVVEIISILEKTLHAEKNAAQVEPAAQ